MSLGKASYSLEALLDKTSVKIGNFRNSRNRSISALCRTSISSLRGARFASFFSATAEPPWATARQRQNTEGAKPCRRHTSLMATPG